MVCGNWSGSAVPQPAGSRRRASPEMETDFKLAPTVFFSEAFNVATGPPRAIVISLGGRLGLFRALRTRFIVQKRPTPNSAAVELTAYGRGSFFLSLNLNVALFVIAGRVHTSLHRRQQSSRYGSFASGPDEQEEHAVGKPDGVFAQPKTGLGTGIVKTLQRNSMPRVRLVVPLCWTIQKRTQTHRSRAGLFSALFADVRFGSVADIETR